MPRCERLPRPRLLRQEVLGCRADAVLVRMTRRGGAGERVLACGSRIGVEGAREFPDGSFAKGRLAVERLPCGSG